MDEISKITEKLQQEMNFFPVNVSLLKKGCYADVYVFQDEHKANVVIKNYRFAGFAGQESACIDLLKSRSNMPFPEIFMCDDDFGFLCMEYVDGKTLAELRTPSPSLAAETVDNLMNLHSVTIETDQMRAEEKWVETYCKKMRDILSRNERLVKDGVLSCDVYNCFERSYSRFPDMIKGNVDRLSLIHGDYTPWNIIVGNSEEHIKAVLDPYPPCIGDPEYDIMMLDKANGSRLGLCALFLQKAEISDAFPKKRIFYNAWNEFCHYYYSDRKKEMEIEKAAEALRKVCEK